MQIMRVALYVTAACNKLSWLFLLYRLFNLFTLNELLQDAIVYVKIYTVINFLVSYSKIHNCTVNAVL